MVAPKKPAARKAAPTKPKAPPKPKGPEPLWEFGPFEKYTEVETPAGTFGLESGQVIRAFPDPKDRRGRVVGIGRV